MGFLISLFYIEIIGIFFMTLGIKKRKYDYSISEGVSLSFFVGMFFVTLQTIFFYLWGIDFYLKYMVAVPSIMLLLAMAHYISRPERINEFKTKAPIEKFTITEKLLIAGIFLQFLWIIFLVLPVPINAHDAVANYAMKAKILYFSGNVPYGFFSLPESVVSHPDYPPMLPFILNWIYAFTGFDDLTANLIMPVIFLAFIALFYSLLRKMLKRVHALLAIFLFITIPQVYDYAATVHADIILTAFITCALAYFILYLRTNSRMQMVLSSLLFGASLWIKNEAIVFTGAFIAACIVYVLRSSRDKRPEILKDVLSGLALIILLAAPWFFVRIYHSAPNSDMDLASLTLARFIRNVRDIPVLLDLFQQEVFGPKKWNIFWVLFFAGLIWKRKNIWRGEVLYLTVFILTAVSGYFTAYMLMNGNDLFFYVNTTISRFMLHFTGISMLFLVYLCKDDIASNLVNRAR